MPILHTMKYIVHNFYSEFLIALLFNVNKMPYSRMFKKVACAVSGGVDSAVSLHLLKKRGFDVCGVYMKNWDDIEESGQCSGAKDEADARKICQHVGVPFTTVNFVKEYWNDVFAYLLKSVEQGFTPNPDIMCNKHIKFDAFFKYAQQHLNVDVVATGHYAANSFGDYLEHFNEQSNAKLLQPDDRVKDQTLFLSQISQHALRRTMFPLARILKPDVKRIASDIGLDAIFRNKRESVGICMIGKREFCTFIDEYIQPSIGDIIDIESGRLCGQHSGIHHFIIGQRVGGISHGKYAYHVAKKLLKSQEIFVCRGNFHSSLYVTSFETNEPHWLCDKHLIEKNFVCQLRYEHPQPLLVWCSVTHSKNGSLTVILDKPLRGINPGQFAVFYLNNECLGSAEIKENGPSLYEQKMSQMCHDYSVYLKSTDFVK